MITKSGMLGKDRSGPHRPPRSPEPPRRERRGKEGAERQNATLKRGTELILSEGGDSRAVAQYCSGGFSTIGEPVRCGITQSPPASISRGISA